MSGLRPDHQSPHHVAQQIRRDKLRVQNISHHPQSQDFPNNLEQFNLDLLQVRNVRNAHNMLDDEPHPPPPGVYSSQVSNFLSTPLNPLEYHELATVAAAEQPSSSCSRVMMHQSELRSLGNWRSSANSNQGCDWFVNYASGSSSMANNESNNPNTTTHLATEMNNVSYNQHYEKPSCFNEFTDVIANREIQKQLGGGVLHHPSSSSSLSPFYQNTLQDIVKSASISAQGSDSMASLMQQPGHGIWVGDGSGLDLHPSYGNQPNQFRCAGGNPWTNRTVDNALRWNSSPLGFIDKKDDEHSGRPLMSNSNPQSLSLSLSSNSQSKTSVSQFEQVSASDDLQCKDPQYMKYVRAFMKPSIVSRDSGKSPQDPVGVPSSTSYRNVGPLGPFTGYATILKSSRFLKSAQQLLDEFCRISSPRFSKSRDVTQRLSGEASASTSTDVITVDNQTEAAAKEGSNSGSSSSMFHGANENKADWGTGSGSCLSPRPDYQQKKARLLFMQEEVTRRYRQYHQQMQMVVSSFESVAGLSSATPYISLALKSVSRHFKCLKNSISDQLKHISEVLGEDFSVPRTSTCGKDDTSSMGRLSCMDQSFQKNKSGRGGTGLVEPQQHVWRPQRGLPEHSVAILKAWLFEHFLHPYPTDTDKHMLATQTGLSRNQVSNWFINARVRVWKPMVEEIHMLETKGTTGANKNNNNNHPGTENERACVNEDGSSSQQHRVMEGTQSKFDMHSLIPENQQQSHQCMELEMESTTNEEQWSQEKRSKLECEMSSTSMDEGSLMMGFMPYSRRDHQVGGLGSVSLTLGLRHGVEAVVQNQQQQQQLQEEQLRRHFGGHMIHDFVG
ncbi:BEL1-like homeodomain protein 9 [Arachis stenosperma]|uniref:BEL1-like homeodomain protein 9 n=1 Tax=Arachis stenosperma TaxID=217475 RepID=UPI0025ABE772|nr:BEL1-like homeodomain protein 9 [Arachis stenosperma]XP_057730915.1 BEL1-like homeodomain protein 9 [Arachis stenosperma]